MMETRLDDLFLRFQTKGFIPIEIPRLIQDAYNMLSHHSDFTIADMNQALENLGWGTEIMDNVTYELINSLVKKLEHMFH
jgi:hypothetical protein